MARYQTAVCIPFTQHDINNLPMCTHDPSTSPDSLDGPLAQLLRHWFRFRLGYPTFRQESTPKSVLSLLVSYVSVGEGSSFRIPSVPGSNNKASYTETFQPTVRARTEVQNVSIARSSICCLQRGSPPEILQGIPPDLTALAPFGTESSVHILPSSRSGKLSPHGAVMYYVGFDPILS